MTVPSLATTPPTAGVLEPKAKRFRVHVPHRLVLINILVLAAVIRTGWTVLAAPPPESDFLTFLTVAQLIAQGHWWPDSYGWSWQGPGYPLLMAPLTLLGAAALPAIYGLNIALGVLSVGLVWKLGARVFGRSAGLVAAAIAACLPGLWLWSPIVSAENLSVPIVLAIAALAVDRHRLGPPVVGLLAGFLVFVRPSMLLYVAAAALSVVWLASSGTRRRSLARFAVGAAVAIATMGLLNIRAGGPALPVGASGWQPWLVYNERATGAWFPAQDADDYPFHGMEDKPALAATVRAAQQKLAIEFAVLNPGEVVPGIVNRHVNNWRSDTAGVDWTLGRPGASAAQSHWAPSLRAFVDSFYLVVIALAFVGAVRFAGRPAVFVALVLPIAYLVAPAAIAEGNARYHVNGLAMLATLAGGAVVVGPTRTRLLALGAAAGTVVVPLAGPPAPVIIAALVTVGGGRVLLDGTRALLRSDAWLARNRNIAIVAGAGAVVAMQAALVVALLAARQVTIDWSLTSPGGWASYVREGAAQLPVGPASVRESPVSARYHKVSYPDAAVLAAAGSRTAARVGLTRLFPDLEIGHTYVLYLQVSGPGVIDRTVDLAVRLNGRTIWEPPRGSQLTAWQDVVVAWTADTPFASVDVERAAGNGADADVLVRSIHLYPKY